MSDEPKEFRIPIACREVFKDDGKRFIFCTARQKVAIEEAYVDGDFYKLPKALVVDPEHSIVIPVASKHNKSSVAGVFAAGLDEKGNIISRFPMAANVQGELEPSDIAIPATSSTSGQFTPLPGSSPIGSRFKRFDVTVAGDVSKLSLDRLQYGLQPVAAAMPFAMVLREGALDLPQVILPGHAVSFVFTNASEEPVTLSGTLVFETAPDSKFLATRDSVQRN